MTELTISPEEIRSAISSYVSSLETGTSREEVGTVADTGDGIAHVEGLPSAMTNELLEFSGGVLGVALNLDVRRDRRGHPRRLRGHRGGAAGQADRRDPLGARRRRVPGPGRRLPGQPDRRPRRHRGGGAARPRAAGRLRDAAPERQRAAADRHQGHRRDDADRARPAPAHHRRPQDRQVRRLHRHDHQPEAELGDRRPEAAGPLHLRRDRAEGLHDRGHPRLAGGSRRAGVHDDRRLPGVGPGRLQVDRPLHRLGARPALDVPGQPRPHRLRRPVQAGRGVPRDLAAAAPPAGPRGLPRRRVLPALAPARALREAVRRARRRLDDRPADHRDQGERRLGLHPDQRHLDHRRPGLPGVRPVQPGRPAGDQRRHLGVPGRRRRPDQGDEAGLRARCGSTCRSTASSRRSPRSAPTSTRRPLPRWVAASGWSSCSSSRQYSPFPVAEEVVSIWLGTSGQLDTVPVADIRRFETRVPRPPAAQRGRDPRRDPRHRQAARRDDRPAQGRGEELQGRVHRRRTGRRSSRRTSRSTRWTRTTRTASRSRSTGRSRPARPRVRGQEPRWRHRSVCCGGGSSRRSPSRRSPGRWSSSRRPGSRRRGRGWTSPGPTPSRSRRCSPSSRSGRRWTTRCSSSGRTPRRPRSWSSPATAARPVATTTTCSRRPRRSRSCCASRARSRSST